MTRTKGLKAEPEDKVGQRGEEVSNKDDDKDLIDINDGLWQSCVRQSNERQGKDICL